MKKYKLARLILIASLGSNAYADLRIDQDFGKKKVIEVSPGRYRLDSFYYQFKDAVIREIAASNEGVAPNSGFGGRDSAHLIWNGVDYYALAANYLSSEQDRRNEEDVRLKIDRPVIPGGGICAVFLHDKQLKPVASVKIALPENNYGTWCNGTYALGSAGKGIDGLLLTISYYLTGEKPAQRAADIGKGWRHMTVLLRLQKEANGKISLVQDDRCLGNPNRYADIPSARKALAKCKDVNNGWIMIEKIIKP